EVGPVVRADALEHGVHPPRVVRRADHVVAAWDGEHGAAQGVAILVVIIALVRVRRAEERPEHAGLSSPVLERGGAGVPLELAVEPLLVDDDAEGVPLTRVPMEIGPAVEGLDEEADDAPPEARLLHRVAERGADDPTGGHPP